MAKTKKEFDKDYIFNLIMPSNPPLPQGQRDELDDEPINRAAALPERPPHSEPPAPKAPAVLASDDPTIPDHLTILRSRLFANEGQQNILSAIPAKNLIVVNLMERLVADRVDSAFEKFNCCKCDKCKKDVMAITLNALSPQYVLADPDRLNDLLQQCQTKEVSDALVKAILQIKNHPQH